VLIKSQFLNLSCMPDDKNTKDQDKHVANVPISPFMTAKSGMAGCDRELQRQASDDFDIVVLRLSLDFLPKVAMRSIRKRLKLVLGLRLLS
jgi:hypothetical protein